MFFIFFVGLGIFYISVRTDMMAMVDISSSKTSFDDSSGQEYTVFGLPKGGPWGCASPVIVDTNHFIERGYIYVKQ